MPRMRLRFTKPLDFLRKIYRDAVLLGIWDVSLNPEGIFAFFARDGTEINVPVGTA